MNINIYLEDSLANSLNKYVKNSGQSRNAVIREAVQEFIKSHAIKRWPNSVLNFKGSPDTTPFENHRDELSPPHEDPFA